MSACTLLITEFYVWVQGDNTLVDCTYSKLINNKNRQTDLSVREHRVIL